MNKPPEYFDLQEVAKFYSDAINELQYPNRPEKPKRENFKNNESYGKALDDYENGAMVDYKLAVKTYHLFEGEILKEFKEELLKRLGLEGHPRANKLYEMAWERGHSSGLSEVVYSAESLAELLEKTT
jgi:hypothetical protein